MYVENLEMNNSLKWALFIQVSGQITSNTLWKRGEVFFLRIWRIFLFLRALVNIPIQTLIIPPWPLLRKMIVSQLELGPPVIQRKNQCLEIKSRWFLKHTFSLNYLQKKSRVANLRWLIEDTPSTFKIQFYSAMKSKHRAINGKLVRSYVIGCHARFFYRRDDNGYNRWRGMFWGQ